MIPMNLVVCRYRAVERRDGAVSVIDVSVEEEMAQLPESRSGHACSVIPGPNGKVPPPSQ